MKNIRVKVWEDRMGNLRGFPIRKDIREKIVAHLNEMHPNNPQSSMFFIQEGTEEEFRQEFLSKQQQKDVENGWYATLTIDPWIVGHWYGWDTHTIFE